jgi:hypothetical protein
MADAEAEQDAVAGGEAGTSVAEAGVAVAGTCPAV